MATATLPTSLPLLRQADDTGTSRRKQTGAVSPNH